MIEKTVLDYLDSKLGAPCYAEVPHERPACFVVVDKTNGSIIGKLGEASIAVQSYAPSKYEAAELNEQAISAMLDIVELPEISRCALNADYPFPDTTAKQYRYQAVLDLTHYDVP